MFILLNSATATPMGYLMHQQPPVEEPEGDPSPPEVPPLDTPEELPPVDPPPEVPR
jgi:hypothetical protein